MAGDPMIGVWRLALSAELGLLIVAAAFILSGVGWRRFRGTSEQPIYLLLMLACVPALVWFSILVSPYDIPATLLWRVASRAVLASPFVAIFAVVWIRMRR